jgi:hypothetical protein
MFCGATGPGILFHDEHIIPKSIRGSWELSSCVCRQCNNALGTEVDVKVWGIPDVVNAHEKLGLPYDANTVFKKHYQAKARMGEQEVPFKAEWTPSGIRLHPYPHTRSDGVMVYPLNDYYKHLQQNLSRKGGYSRSSLDDLRCRIDEAKPGDKVDHPAQHKYFVKGYPEKITVEIVPRGDYDVGRLIAKIAFEFLYVTTPCLLDWPAVAEPLRLYSRHGTPNDTISIRRVKSDRAGFEAFHSITCQLQAGIVVYVTLFGFIVYELLMRVPPNDTFLKRIRAATRCPDLVGFGFEQDIDSQSRGLRAWLASGGFETIAVW